MPELLKVIHLKKYFSLGKGIFSKTKGIVKAINDVSFEIKSSETLGLVGESGSGKTTIGRCVLRLIKQTAGQIFFEGKDITDLPTLEMRERRRDMQIIFQDPYGSLPSRMRISAILKEPLDIHNIGKPSERKDKVAHILEKVGLRHEYMSRFPHEFSGGQRQRISIARAIMMNPKFIVADEPVSALDVSIQAQIINLLVKLQKELRLSYLLISHDMSVIKYMSDRIAVMYMGKIVEMASRDDIYFTPLHPYTKALLSAIPVPKLRKIKNRLTLGGEMPNPANPPSGCNFNPRCRHKIEVCDKVEPQLINLGNDHFVSCHLI